MVAAMTAQSTESTSSRGSWAACGRFSWPARPWVRRCSFICVSNTWGCLGRFMVTARLEQISCFLERNISATDEVVQGVKVAACAFYLLQGFARSAHRLSCLLV